MTESPQVSVHITSGAGEIIRLVATLMVFGGAGAIGWALAHTGYAELAGSGLTVMIVTAAKLMWKRGMFGAPSTPAADDGLAETRSTMKRLSAEWSALMARASVLVIVVIAFAYAIAFLALRAAMIRALTVFGNPWIAGGSAAIAGAFVVMPTLLPTIAAAMRGRAAPSAPAAPTTSTVPHAYPAPTPATTPPAAPAAQPIVMRRKTTKENENHA